MDRRKPILNRSEAAAESALREAAKKNDARVFTKVRIADALRIDRSGLPGPLWRYALQGHFGVPARLVCRLCCLLCGLVRAWFC